MQTCVSFLRGVNMTGHNSIKMTDLSELYKNLGFRDVETYIQSGNVICGCNSDNSREKITKLIEEAILQSFGFNIAVMLRTSGELKDIIDSNPFSDEGDFNPERLAVIFLHETPDESQLVKVRNVNYPPDKFRILGREIFIYCPGGFGKTKLYTNFFEKKMKVTGTARNWRTINTVYGMAAVLKYPNL